MNAHCLYYLLIIGWLTISHLTAAEPHVLKTEIGQYEIHEFLKLPPGAIELSPDGKYLLRDQAGQLFGYELPNLETPSSSMNIAQPGNWRFADSKIIVGIKGGWDTHVMPSLEHERTIQLPSAISFDSNQFANVQTIPQLVDEGWLIHGLVFNPDATKVIGTMRGWQNGHWVDLSKEQRVDESQLQFVGRTIQINADRENKSLLYSPAIALQNNQGRIPGLVDAVDFTPEGFHLLGADRLSYPMVNGIPMEGFRCGAGWFSARVMRSGPTTEPCHVLVKVIAFEGRKTTRQFGLFSLAQPTLLLDSKATFAHATTEGDKIEDLQIVTWPRIHNSSLTMMELDRNDPRNQEPIHWLFNNWYDFHGSYSTPDSIDALRKVLQKYIDGAKIEYEVATGQPATEVPISIRVGIKQGERRHEYFVWTQISEDELLCSFGTDFLNSLVEQEYQNQLAFQRRKANDRYSVTRSQQNQQVIVARENRKIQAEADFKATRTLFIVSTCISLFIGLACLVGVCILSYRLRNLAIILWAVLLPSNILAQGNKPPDNKAQPNPTQTNKTQGSKAPSNKAQGNKTQGGKAQNSKTQGSKAKASKTLDIDEAELWSITFGGDIISQVGSFRLAGTNHQLKIGYHSGIALLRYQSEKGQPSLAAIDIKEMRVLMQVALPAEWNWETTTVCSQYAACVQGNKLLVMDTNSGKVVKELEVPRPGKPVILFDKALWLEPNLWFALPSLKPVTQHPIVDPGAKARWLSGYTAPPFMLDSNRCVIDGVEFDSNLRETGRFFGHAQNLDPANWISPVELSLGKVKAKDEPANAKNPKMVWLLNRFLQIKEQPLVPLPDNAQLAAYPPDTFSVPQATDCLFYAYQDGLWSLRDGWLIVLQTQDKYKGHGLCNHSMFPTPFLESTSPAVEVPLSKANGKPWVPSFSATVSFFHRSLPLARSPWKDSKVALLKPLDNRYTSGEKMGFAFEHPVNHSVTLTVPPDWDAQFDIPLVLGNCILEQIVMWSGTSRDAGWDEVAKAYREQCAHWTKFAPEALRQRQDLFPVELALRTDIGLVNRNEYWASIVLYFPEEQIKSLFEKLHSRATNKKELFLESAQALPEQIALFEQRDRKVVVPAKKEVEPVPEADTPEANQAPPQAAKPPVVLTDPQARPSLGLLIQVFLMPISIALRGLYLTGAIWTINQRAERKSDKLAFPGGWLAIGLVAATWVTLEFALNNGFSMLAFYLMGVNIVTKLVIFCFGLMISLSVILALVNILSDPENERMNSVALRAFACVAVVSLPGLPLLLAAS